ncbi:NAD-dependent epimerase/dehydratase family protein [Campylobacter lanienae]|uniref:NAD-dependent epimerase/dehydratase family protein n=1 Tax=Campylobacter lanienae TaxID=75658 RepID=UPI000BB406FC|nr:NAD-dependent epimerase/dehydratase family protein [Campylobacter lanienae]
MNILITGGAGFIGSELGKFLLKKGYNVRILDNLEYGYRDNFEDNEILLKNFIQADIREDNFEKYLKNTDVVYHFAGISALPECESNPNKAFDVNTTGVANVLNAIRKSNVKRFVFASTSAIYENNPSNEAHKETDDVHPNLIYATTKYCAEQVCKSFAQNYGMDIVICRFFNVFGPHQDFKRKYPPFTSFLIREALVGRKPTIYNTEDCKRDYIYVYDLMQYLYRMAISDKKYNADIFNLATGKAYSAMEIAKTIYSALDIPFEFDKGEPLKFWDKYEELFNAKYNLKKERVKQEVFKHCLGDGSKVKNEFNYEAKTNLIDGLKEIIDYQQNYKNNLKV